MAIFHSSPFMEMTESLTATPGCHVKMKQKQVAGEASDKDPAHRLPFLLPYLKSCMISFIKNGHQELRCL